MQFIKQQINTTAGINNNVIIQASSHVKDKQCLLISHNCVYYDATTTANIILIRIDGLEKTGKHNEFDIILTKKNTGLFVQENITTVSELDQLFVKNICEFRLFDETGTQLTTNGTLFIDISIGTKLIK